MSYFATASLVATLFSVLPPGLIEQVKVIDSKGFSTYTIKDADKSISSIRFFSFQLLFLPKNLRKMRVTLLTR